MKRIGIDVGGTFTDVIIIDEISGEVRCDKFPSTPDDQSQAIIHYMKDRARDLSDVRALVHGSTVAVNALIEGRGAILGLITTMGHKHRLDIQRCNVEGHHFDFNYRKPAPLIPLHLRRELTARTLSDGSILSPVDPSEVLSFAQELVEQEKVQGICVCLLNSYVNPQQEQEVKRLIKANYAGIPVVCSSELAEVLEFERFSTCVINTFLMPEVDRYLAHLEQFLAANGLPGERFMIMQGNGGMASAAVVRDYAALTIESGPAGGVVASQHIGKLVGEDDLITFDMGGTSTDVCLIRKGQADITTDYKVLGYPIKFPLVDIRSVGAGGGSIAWIDDLGSLHVGPKSAGADPGPACYGRGGRQPTVSDAHVVLGRLRPELPLAGVLQVKVDLAASAMSSIANAYGLSTADAAANVIKIVNENMANALKVISVHKGLDPKDFTLVAFGGAGPMHAGMMMKLLGITKCIVPPFPGAHSALGLALSDIKHDYVRSILKPTHMVDIDHVHHVYQELSDRGRGELLREGVEERDIHFEMGCDMRYLGQAYVPAIIPFAASAPGKQQLAETEQAFHRIHRQLYRHGAETEATEIVSLRVRALGRQPSVASLRGRSGTGQVPRPVKKRAFFEDQGEFVECSFFLRSELSAGYAVSGPAVIHQFDSITLVYSDQQATQDELGNLWIRG